MNNPHLEIRDFRFFVAVAEELHFRRAAERLGIAQPHLSLHIRQLEERLGVKLFDRNTRSVKLTAAGTKLLERAHYTLAQVEEAVASVRRLGDDRRAQLNIAFTPAASYQTLPWILREFRRRHPDVHLNLSYMHTAAQVQELCEGRLDFGFLRPPVHSTRLSTPTLTREGAVIALPRSHRLAEAAEVRLEDFADEDFVHFGAGLGFDFQEQIMSCCHRAGFTPRLTVEALDTHSSILMVAAGFGVSIIPEWVGTSSHPEVVFRRLNEIPEFIYLAAAWQSDNRSPVYQAFKGVLDAYLQAHPISWV